MRTPKGTSLTLHLLKQAQAKGFNIKDVYAAIDNPSIRYQSRRKVGQERRIRNGIVVIVDTLDNCAVTVHVHEALTERRKDQNDRDARRHFANR